MSKILFVAPASNLNTKTEILGAIQGQQVALCQGEVDRAKLDQYLYNDQYDIIHFAGHGESSILILSDGALEVQDLLIMLSRQHMLKNVVITACNSARVGSEIHNAHHVPVVMCQAPIGDVAAIAFSERYYRAYRTTGDVQRAVEVGRATLAKEYPAYADVVTLINGDDLTKREREAYMKLVDSRLSEMDMKVDRIETTVNEIKSQQGRTLLIFLALLLAAQMLTPVASFLLDSLRH